MTESEFKDTPDDVAVRVEKIGQKPGCYKDWRSFGLDPVKMDRDPE